MKTAAVVLVAASWLSSALPSLASDPPSWRASVTSELARTIAGQLFPDKCGDGGLSCGITYDDRRRCPFEFVVVFSKREKDEPPIAVVTLDKHGGVVSVSSTKKGSCTSDKS